jgi:hypothetical protein
MSLLSYQLLVKRYQRELGLNDRTFNALDVKYNDINLLKQLQILNPVLNPVVAAVAPSGWYGDFTITNSGSSQTAMYIVSVIRNDTNFESVGPTSIILEAGESITLSLTQAERLATPQTQFKIFWEGDESGITTIESITGLTLVNYDTGYEPPGSSSVIANYTVDSAYINNQAIQLTILMTAP